MTQIDYMTVVQPVQEVTLVCRAEAAPWEEMLAAEGFQKQIANNSLEIIISATQASYQGIPFRECSISVRTGEHEFLLCHAYNSLRFFAFTERRFFRTPYFFADIEIAHHRIAVRQRGKCIFKAMLSTYAPTIGTRHETHEWKIHLPQKSRKDADTPHYFFARLEGETAHYTADCAELEFPHPSPDHVMERLQQSNLQATNWMVRPQARHSKSRTMYGTIATP